VTDLLQAKYRDDSWRLLVVCALLNRTTGRQVEGVIDALFARWPTAEAMVAADPAEIGAVIRPCGLWRLRAARLVALSEDWAAGRPVEQCRGVGPYALDSYRLLVLGERGPLASGDRALAAWLEARAGTCATSPRRRSRGASTSAAAASRSAPSPRA